MTRSPNVRRVLRLAAIAALAASASGGFAAAQGVFIAPPPSVMAPQALTGKRGRVARELSHFGYGGTDVSQLSNQTIALLDNAIHGSGSQSYRQGRIASILSGGGVLQRTIDRFGRRY